MPSPHSIERRELVLSLVESGFTTREICELAKVGEASVRRWKFLKRTSGGLEPLPHGGGCPPTKLLPEVVEKLIALVDQNPDETLKKMADWMFELFGEDLNFRTVSRALRRQGYSIKKKTYQLREEDPEKHEAQRADFRKIIDAIDPEKLLFLDETGSNLAMTPTRARSQTGERAYASRPTRRGKKRNDNRRNGVLGNDSLHVDRRRGQ